MRFRKKPVVIDAVQFDGSIQSLRKMATNLGFLAKEHDFKLGNDGWIKISTLEGEHRADVGDWVIKGIKGEFYPVKPDIFEATYDPVEASS